MKTRILITICALSLAACGSNPTNSIPATYKLFVRAMPIQVEGNNSNGQQNKQKPHCPGKEKTQIAGVAAIILAPIIEQGVAYGWKWVSNYIKARGSDQTVFGTAVASGSFYKESGPKTQSSGSDQNSVAVKLNFRCLELAIINTNKHPGDNIESWPSTAKQDADFYVELEPYVAEQYSHVIQFVPVYVSFKKSLLKGISKDKPRPVTLHLDFYTPGNTPSTVFQSGTDLSKRPESKKTMLSASIFLGNLKPGYEYSLGKKPVSIKDDPAGSGKPSGAKTDPNKDCPAVNGTRPNKGNAAKSRETGGADYSQYEYWETPAVPKNPKGTQIDPYNLVATYVEAAKPDAMWKFLAASVPQKPDPIIQAIAGKIDQWLKIKQPSKGNSSS